MTVTAYRLARDEAKADFRGSSVRLGRLPFELHEFRKPQSHHTFGGPQRLRGSNGVSAGATIIEDWLHELFANVQRWPDTQPDTAPDIENEEVVFMPPLSERSVTLRVLWSGPADPLVFVDELNDDIAND